MDRILKIMYEALFTALHNGRWHEAKLIQDGCERLRKMDAARRAEWADVPTVKTPVVQRKDRAA